jgi:hypothetical protein
MLVLAPITGSVHVSFEPIGRQAKGLSLDSDTDRLL